MNFKETKTKVGTLVMAITLMAGTMSAFAGTTEAAFSFSLPGFNSSKSTATQEKDTTGKAGNVSDYYTGASVNIDARMVDEDNQKGAWTRNLNKSSKSYTLEAHDDHEAGENIRAEFSSDITTTVAVDISGNWKSN